MSASSVSAAPTRERVSSPVHRDPKTGEVRDPKTIFLVMDEDGDGRVDREEFGVALELCGVSLTEDEVALVWKALDEDGGGDLDAGELVTKLEVQFEQVQAFEAGDKTHQAL
jgi:Ca2+-binding EF-hand superfamily protein